MTKGVCVRARKEVVWVLLGKQYGSQCESKRGDCLGPNEVGTLVRGMRMFV